MKHRHFNNILKGIIGKQFQGQLTIIVHLINLNIIQERINKKRQKIRSDKLY